jgi:hypothetical protein
VWFWVRYAALSLLLLAAFLRFVTWPLVTLFGSYFEHRYPHDGQNSLGAFIAGILASITLSIVLAFALLFLSTWRFKKLIGD